MNDLTECIQATTDARELKRALTLAGAAWADVMDNLQVSHVCISTWRCQDTRYGIASLRMGYHGSVGYLTAEQKAQIIAWLRRQTTWAVTALQHEMTHTYGVAYASTQSDYALMSEAQLSWKKAQAQTPKGDPEQIAATREEIQKNHGGSDGDGDAGAADLLCG